MTISDMKPHDIDNLGNTIKYIYAFKPPRYAVYGTNRSLMIRYADDPTVETDQRRGLAALYPLRGEINGLIDGWRQRAVGSRLANRAERYDRRVSDALVVALEHDVDSAEKLLERIKDEIIEYRTRWARVQYIFAAFGATIAVVSLMEAAAWLTGIRHSYDGQAKSVDPDPYDLFRAASAGTLGALFSIAIGIRSRAALPELSIVSNITDATLRVVIGVIAAGVLMSLVSAKAVTIGMGQAVYGANGTPLWLFALIVGFLAGFSERMVPDLLAKVSAAPQAPLPPTSQPLPAAEAGQAASRRIKPRVVAPLDTDSANASDRPDTDDAPVDAEAKELDSAVDHCLCDIPMADSEITGDDELPAASGGVETRQEA